MKFQCKFYDKQRRMALDKIITGKEYDVELFAEKNGYDVLEKTPILEKKRISATFGNARRLNDRDLYVFCRSLGTLINSGTPLPKSLYFCAKKFEGVIVQKLETMGRESHLGIPIADAAKNSGLFDEYFIGMLEMEKDGVNLIEILYSCAEYYKDQGDLKSTLLSKFTMPVILVSAACLVATGMQYKHTPFIQKQYKMMRIKPGEDMVTYFSFSSGYRSVFPFVVLALVIVCIIAYKNHKFRSLVIGIICSLWKKLRVLIQVLREYNFVCSFHLQKSSKQNDVTALRRSSSVLKGTPLESEILTCAEKLKDGISLHTALKTYTSLGEQSLFFIDVGTQGKALLADQLKELKLILKEDMNIVIDRLASQVTRVGFAVVFFLILALAGLLLWPTSQMQSQFLEQMGR